MPTRDELFGVPYKAPMIVEGYLQQDAGGVVGSGETRKTTAMLYECVHIVLGRPLYGKRTVARMYGTPIYIWENGKVVAKKP